MESKVLPAHGGGDIGGVSQDKNRPEAGATSCRAVQALPEPAPAHLLSHSLSPPPTPMTLIPAYPELSQQLHFHEAFAALSP